MKPFLDVFSEAQVKVRSKRSNFQIYKCEQKVPILTSFSQESNGVICFYLRPPKVIKIAFEKVTSLIGMISETKTAHFGVKN